MKEPYFEITDNDTGETWRVPVEESVREEWWL